jgi:hypothetical protein
MVAGYLGLLPLLQSLAAEPAWPAAPAAATSGAVSNPVTMGPIQETQFASAPAQPVKEKPRASRKHVASQAARPQVRSSSPQTSARPAPKVQLPSGLAGGSSPPDDTGASQSSGG